MASPGADRRQRQPSLSHAADNEKRVAATAAAELVEDGMRVGLGTGSTVAYLLPALVDRGLTGLRCVATSPATEQAARALGLDLFELGELGELDIAIDGADQVANDGWLVKGGGGAHTREKIVAAAARRFVVIVSSEKVVERLSPPVPVELLRFGAERTLATLEPVRLREGRESPDGGLLADCLCAVEDPARLAAWLAAVPGVVEHGLFGSQMVSDVLVANGDDVEHRALS
jgi:ribose 5-phosphate isomerase A